MNLIQIVKVGIAARRHHEQSPDRKPMSSITVLRSQVVEERTIDVAQGPHRPHANRMTFAIGTGLFRARERSIILVLLVISPLLVYKVSISCPSHQLYNITYL
jgi:hypothetical protein